MIMHKDKLIDITYEVSDGVALITIDRQKKMNTLTMDMYSSLITAIKRADEDRSVRVVILTASGQKAFSAGVDVLSLPEDLSIPERRWFFINFDVVFNRLLLHTEKVTIAAVNGIALGAAFEASLLCDFTIAAESAKFGMPEVKVGLYPGTFSPIYLLYLMGRKRANDLLLRGKIIDASEASTLGLVNEVVPDAEVLDRARELAKEIIMNTGILPVSMYKARLNSEMRNLLDGEMSRFVEFQTLTLLSKDGQEGLNALREKRKPVFTGK
jgi:enoyl-CoA hydratase